MKKIAVLQSNYIPWKGYFDIIGMVDEFILYDEVQYTTNDWRNRNRIKTPSGPVWLTIPVLHNRRFGQRIDEARVSDRRWPKKHCQSLLTYYSKAPFFKVLFPSLEAVYASCADEERLSAINRAFLQWVCDALGMVTRIRSSLDYPSDGDRNERLVALCKLAGAGAYLSGPAARQYLDVAMFRENSIAVRWMDYSGYPEYPQLHGPVFRHDVTVLDLLFNVGPEAAWRYIKSPRPDAKRDRVAV
ncbi:WbqC family protein [Desulfolutivibrio sulfoxidireducens]|uniref:WbqC family protein n=1 Tax=Desulfolutivibrio sulfoxidireducens TaxID=2773299 RepID=UPI00159D3601|nr:WbqC family protein [Desulfolutivibrio sulfoxidireducens]QLA15808.1 hypothetical protein GD605_06440 [Desulfolutivibrio sulfoxidireducens]